ncbi:MAG: hypothetical protein R3A13_05430 [Bdellovibrionota bacterium]
MPAILFGSITLPTSDALALSDDITPIASLKRVRFKNDPNRKTKRIFNAIVCDNENNTLARVILKNRKVDSPKVKRIKQDPISATDAKAFLKTTPEAVVHRISLANPRVTNAKGKLIVKSKKKKFSDAIASDINAEIDSCIAGPASQMTEGSGSWMDSPNGTSGEINYSAMADAQDAETPDEITENTVFDVTLEIKDVGGMPLGCVDTSELPAEMFTFSASAAESPKMVEDKHSNFIPGTLSNGMISIDTENLTYTYTADITHDPDACAFANTMASFTATGPLKRDKSSNSAFGQTEIEIQFPAIGDEEGDPESSFNGTPS